MSAVTAEQYLALCQKEYRALPEQEDDIADQELPELTKTKRRAFQLMGRLEELHKRLRYECDVAKSAGDTARKENKKHLLTVTTDLYKEVHKYYTVNSTLVATWAEFPVRGYTKLRMLRKSLMGVVVLAQRNSDQLRVAIKFSRVAEADKNAGTHEDVKFEAKALRAIAASGHPGARYVVRLVDFFKGAGFYWTITEFCEGGELFGLIVNGVPDPAICRRFAKQIVLGMQAVHATGIAHLDLSLEQLLMTAPDPADAEIRIIDFGAGQTIPEGRLLPNNHRRPHKKEYCGPETYAGEAVDGVKFDIWSFGIILYYLNAGAKTYLWQFPSAAYDEFYKYFRARGLRRLLAEYHSRGLIPLLPETLLSLLEAILRRDAASRPSLDRVLQHPWFTREGKDAKRPDAASSSSSSSSRTTASTAAAPATSGSPPPSSSSSAAATVSSSTTAACPSSSSSPSSSAQTLPPALRWFSQYSSQQQQSVKSFIMGSQDARTTLTALTVVWGFTPRQAQQLLQHWLPPRQSAQHTPATGPG